MTDPRTALRHLGEVANIRSLRRLGVVDADLRRQARLGRITRIRIGWYASDFADVDQIAAVALGGRLGCVSALRRMSVWAGDDDGLHVHVPPTRSGAPRTTDASHNAGPPMPSPRDAALGPAALGPPLDPAPLEPAVPLPPPARPAVMHRAVPNLALPSSAVLHPAVLHDRRRPVPLSAPAVPAVLHWRPEPWPDAALDWIVSPGTALAEAVRCQPTEHAQAAVDTMVGAGLLTRVEIEGIVAAAPARVGVVVDDLSGCVDSGAESIALRGLRAAGFSVRPQFQLLGHGRFDALVEECVVFEVDGWEFHRSREQFLADRERTLIAQSFGLTVVRAAATQVRSDWPTVLAAVSRAVADAKRFAAARHPGRGRRAG